MTSAATKTIQIKRPNLTREGASLRESVASELGWLRNHAAVGSAYLISHSDDVKSPTKTAGSKKAVRKTTKKK